jgi:hypothetical protein
MGSNPIITTKQLNYKFMSNKDREIEELKIKRKLVEQELQLINKCINRSIFSLFIFIIIILTVVVTLIVIK